MSLITPFTSFPGAAQGSDILSGDPAVYRRQMSRLKAYTQGKRADAKKTRAHRKAFYKEQLKHLQMGGKAKDLHKSNPRQLGHPRKYKLLVAGEDAVAKNKLLDPHFFHDEGHWIFFPAFGVPGKPVCLNSGWIASKDVTVKGDRTLYTIQTRDTNGELLALALNFRDPKQPTGHLWTAEGEYELRLQPYAIEYNVHVSADAGAYISQGNDAGLTWDVNSSDWQAASWEKDSLIFAYDSVAVENDFGEPFLVNEAAFTDRLANDKTFSLEANDVGDYNALMGLPEPDGTTQFLITVQRPTIIPPPPPERTDSVVISVFPRQYLIQFDAFPIAFTGAYVLPTGQIYAVTGEALDDKRKPLRDSFQREKRPFFRSGVTAIRNDFEDGKSRKGNKRSDLIVNTLFNLDPMEQDDDSPTGWYDTCAAEANKDFTDIIAYHMDEDLRTTFIQTGPVLLDPTVQTIADDGNDSKSFYQSLQVPYVTSSLARSTLEEGKQCNGARAQAMLRQLPADSEVYKRHTDKLYRYRFRKKFQEIQDFLDDQDNQDDERVEKMQHAAEKMKQRIRDANEGMSEAGDPATAEQNLNNALADIDALLEWAINDKLWWAFQLYNNEVLYNVPKMAAELANGNASQYVSHHVKTLNGVFGLLERGSTNPNGNGKTFQQAYNDVLRVYMMTALIPQLVDPSGVSEDWDSILVAVLDDLWRRWIENPNPDLAESANDAKLLAMEDAVRQGFFNNFNMSLVLAGSLNNWSQIITTFDRLNQGSEWYKKLKNGARVASTFTYIGSAMLMFLPLMQPGATWDSMSDAQRTELVADILDVGMSLTIKGIQGTITLTTLWDDLGGFSDKIKAFFGFGKLLEKLPSAAKRVESEFARWLVRTPQEAASLAGGAVTTSMKIFGRSAGEFLTNVVGSVLGVVDLVLTAIDLANATDPLQIAMDSLMVASTSLQLLAIGANWLISAEFVVGEAAVGILETAAACMGPLSIAFAVVGFIIMLVMMFLPQDPPNPVKDFVDEQADKAGLKMQYGAEIDYFHRIPPDEAANSLEGVSFQGGKLFLALGKESAATDDTFAVKTAKEVTYYPDTCWNVSTNWEGKTMIYTYVKDHTDTWVAVCLGRDVDNTLTVTRPPSKTKTDSEGNTLPVDEDKYHEALARQQWQCTCIGVGDLIGEGGSLGEDDTHLKSAPFWIRNAGQTLIINDLGTPTLSALPIYAWTLEIQPMGPGEFHYARRDWILSTDNRDDRNRVILTHPMSEPLTWTISPSLPSFLELVESEEEGGTVQQVAGAAPKPMDAKEYKVTAEIKIAGNTLTYDGKLTITVGTDEAPSRGTPRLKEFESYEDLVNNAPPLFLWQQQQLMDMPDHYTAKVALCLLQHHNLGRWYVPQVNPGGFDVAAEYFPHRKSPIPEFEEDFFTSFTFFLGAEGFIASEVYRQQGEFAGDIDTEEAQSLIDSFGQFVWDSNFELFLSWLKWEQSKPVTGGLCSLEDYKACLTSPFWISEKKSQQTSGTWTNQSREMFLHFLKLQAIGATDAEIASIYKTITAPSNPSAPALDPSGFGDVKPDNWRSWKAYIVQRPLNQESSDYLRVRVDRWAFWQDPDTHFPRYSYLDYEFLHDSSVWDAGSCFRAGTLLLMGDQTSVQPIETIQPGDWVSSPTPSGDASRRRVGWISRPARSRRPLYALRDRPGIWFTSSHPIQRGVDDHGLPIIGFVHPRQAVHLNPTWAAWTIQAIPSTELVQLGVSDKEEALYDLVFESDGKSNSEISFYIVRATNGQDLVVGSEAPNPACLPATAAFVLSLSTAGGPRAAQLLQYVSEQRRPELIRNIHHHAKTILEEGPPRECPRPTMGLALSMLRDSSPSGAQAVADAIEAFISSVGLSLEVIAHNGWQFQATPRSTSPSTEECICLSPHFLQFAQPDAYRRDYTKVTPPQGYADAIKRIRGLLQNETVQVGVEASREDLGDADTDRAPDANERLQRECPALIAPIARGANMFRLRADLAFSNTKPGTRDSNDSSNNNNAKTAWTIRIVISTASESMVLYAKGSLRDDGCDMRWQVYIEPGGAAGIVPDVEAESALYLWHVGFLTVSATAGVPIEKVQTASRWGLDGTINEGGIESESESSPEPLVRYMWSLGEAVGKDLLTEMLEGESDMGE